MILNANDILTVQKRKQEKRYASFDHILEKINKLIMKCTDVMRNINYCYYDVPEFIIGQPLYDLNECIQYLVIKLTEQGFYVKYFFPRSLHISWAGQQYQPLQHKHTKHEPTQSLVIKPKPKSIQTTKVGQQRKSVMTTRKNSGKFILDLT